MTRRTMISVIGDARIDDELRIAEARALGAALVGAGFRIVTGGLGGVMEQVSYGARHGSGWFDGAVIGILPSYRASDANPWCDVVIPTGMQIGRNTLVVASGAVVVTLGGGAGTLSEIAIAWQLGKPILALGDAGWSGRLAGTPIDSRGAGAIEACRTVAEVVKRCRVLAATVPEAGNIGDGWRKDRP